MKKSIKRRDFLNGAAIAIAAGSTLPARSLFASGSESAEPLLHTPVPDGLEKEYYPPTLTGIRGSHNGSFEVAHDLAWRGDKPKQYSELDEDYDLIIVGGDISGLTAAYLYQQQAGADKNISLSQSGRTKIEWLRVGVIGVLLVLLAIVGTGCAMDAGEEQAPSPIASTSESTDWELLGNSPDMQHHSDLSQINTETVSDLGLAWAIDLPTRDGLVGNPLIRNGRIFQGGSQSQIFANDLKTGKLLWTYEPLADRPPGSFLETWLRSLNRGLALYEDLVIVGTSDCRLVAVDQATGAKRWETETCDSEQAYMITGAPRVGGGKVFIGNSCADLGLNRGHVDAVDARTGKYLWRFYTVPGDPSKPQDSELYEMAAKTWGEGWYEKTRGCGSVWDAMVYDSELDQLIIGTGAPAPSDPTKRGKDAGDELFTNAVVALDAETGAYRWHFSQVPGDAWNYEPAVGLMMASLPIDDEGRRVVLSVPKNGFVYLLDANTGEFISGRNYVPVNWAKGLDDETGRPIFDPAARYWEAADGEPTIVLPSESGAHDWTALAFDPQKNVLFIPAMTMPERFERTASGEYSYDYRHGSQGDPEWQAFAELVAWDPVTQSEVWRQRHALPVNGGALHTAGGLVFQGTAEGYLNAYDAASGEQLGSFAAGGAIRAAPSTVVADGLQYIVVPAGAPSTSAASAGLTDYSSTKESRSRPRLLAFVLGGDAPTPAWAAQLTFPKPWVDRYPPEAAAMGEAIYEGAGCGACHGFGGQSVGGAAADLRMRLPANLDYLKAVLGGAFAPRMPEVALDDASTEALYAYLVNTAWHAYEDTNADPRAVGQE